MSPGPSSALPAAAGPTATTAAASLTFDGVGKSFPSPDGRSQRQVLRGVSFDVAPGEIVSVLGPSGCGKSTLLRAVAGLSEATEGRVLIDQDPVRGIDARCAVGFQEPRLLPWRTLERNAALGLPRGIAREEGRARIARLLELVGLAGHAQDRPSEVSGGMAQRASLARALARGPQVLLLDEPFGALDALTRLKMQDLLLEVHRADPTTVLMVTHDVEEALVLSDRVVVLGRPEPDGPAGIAEILTVEAPRPRRRDDPDLTHTRTRLLGLLGVAS